MATYNSVNENRKKNWLVNAVRYNWMKTFDGKRYPNLWLFSAWEGQKYADNTQYFFEYMLENHPEIRCIWQTRNQRIFRSLQESGKPVQLIGTKAAEKTQKEAGVVFYTNGLDDFGDFPFVYGALIVSLWHGVGFKKIYRELYGQRNSLMRSYSNAKWNFFSWVKRDITIVTSEGTERQFRDGFLLKKADRVIIAGQPRNDVFARKAELCDAVKNANIIKKTDNRRIVLYMPTFRKESGVLVRQLDKLWKSSSFERMLADNKAVFMTKLHYLNQGNMTPTDYKILLNDGDVVDSQVLLRCADVLITDYSSCAIDFALQKKPILFYFPDWEEYGAKDCMREGTKEACSVNCAETPEELENKIGETLRSPESGIRQAEKLNQIFDGTGVSPGQYSENVYKKVMACLKSCTNKESVS